MCSFIKFLKTFFFFQNETYCQQCAKKRQTLLISITDTHINIKARFKKNASKIIHRILNYGLTCFESVEKKNGVINVIKHASIPSMWSDLKNNYEIKNLITRNFNQDPLEIFLEA